MSSLPTRSPVTSRTSGSSRRTGRRRRRPRRVVVGERHRPGRPAVAGVARGRRERCPAGAPHEQAAAEQADERGKGEQHEAATSPIVVAVGGEVGWAFMVRSCGSLGVSALRHRIQERDPAWVGRARRPASAATPAPASPPTPPSTSSAISPGTSHVALAAPRRSVNPARLLDTRNASAGPPNRSPPAAPCR